MTVVPAYGRDYKSKEEVLAAWESNKDFQIADVSHPDNGRYINKSDALRYNVKHVTVRYNKAKRVIELAL